MMKLAQKHHSVINQRLIQNALFNIANSLESKRAQLQPRLELHVGKSKNQ